MEKDVRMHEGRVKAHQKRMEDYELEGITLGLLISDDERAERTSMKRA